MHGLPSGRDGGLDRCIVAIQPLVDLLLPAFGGNGLVKVPLRIHEADADERNAEIARLLAMVAGEHAEAAGVDRQRLMERKLRREIRDGAIGIRVAPPPPGVLRGPRRVERIDRGVVEDEEALVDSRVREHLLRNEPQHEDRVVRGLPPERVVEPAEDFAGLWIPGPPEIVGQLREPAQTIGDFRGLRRCHDWEPQLQAPTS